MAFPPCPRYSLCSRSNRWDADHLRRSPYPSTGLWRSCAGGGYRCFGSAHLSIGPCHPCARTRQASLRSLAPMPRFVTHVFRIVCHLCGRSVPSEPRLRILKARFRVLEIRRRMSRTRPRMSEMGARSLKMRHPPLDMRRAIFQVRRRTLNMRRRVLEIPIAISKMEKGIFEVPPPLSIAR